MRIKTKTKNKINQKDSFSKEAPGSIYPMRRIKNQFRKNPLKGKTETRYRISTPADLVSPILKEKKPQPKGIFPKTESSAKETPLTTSQFQNSKLKATWTIHMKKIKMSPKEL